MKEIKVYCEITLCNGVYTRAFPDYHNTGEWYDWIMINWGEDSKYPAQALSFYLDKNKQLKAIIHKATDCQSSYKLQDSPLLSHFQIEYNTTGQPNLASVEVASIENVVLAFHHTPSTDLFDSLSPLIMTLHPQNEWSHQWIIWNEELRKKNQSSTKNSS